MWEEATDRIRSIDIDTMVQQALNNLNGISFACFIEKSDVFLCTFRTPFELKMGPNFNPKARSLSPTGTWKMFSLVYSGVVLAGMGNQIKHCGDTQSAPILYSAHLSLFMETWHLSHHASDVCSPHVCSLFKFYHLHVYFSHDPCPSMCGGEVRHPVDLWYSNHWRPYPLRGEGPTDWANEQLNNPATSQISVLSKY